MIQALPVPSLFDACVLSSHSFQLSHTFLNELSVAKGVLNRVGFEWKSLKQFWSVFGTSSQDVDLPQYKDLTGNSRARTSPCSAIPLSGTDSLSFKPWHPTVGTSHSLAILGSNSTILCQSLNPPHENAGGLSSTHIYRLNSTCPSQEEG